MTIQLDNARASLEFWRPLVRLPEVHVWALLADEDGETSFKPRPGDHDQAFGIFQWHTPRILDMIKGCGIDVRTAPHGDQLRAAYFEMTKGAYKHVWPALMATETVPDAITILVRDFERSLNQAQDVQRRTALVSNIQQVLGEAA